VYASNRDRPMPSNPSQFAMVLRKHLNNSRFIAVRQYGFDRVIELTFEHGGGRLKLVIELFRDGNVLLLDEEGVIIQPLTHAKYASRTLKRGVAYTPPPETFDPRQMDRAALDELLDGSEHDLIRTLAARANFGRVYGSTACSVAGLEEKMDANSLDSEQRDALEQAIRSMLDGLSAGTGAMMWMSDAEAMAAWNMADNEADRDAAAAGISEIAPIDLSYTDAEAIVEVGSLSLAYDAVFGSHDAAAFIRREEERLVDSGEDEGERQAKLDRRASQQRGAIDRFHERAAITQELGKAIQDSWEHVESILTQFNAAVESESWQSVEGKIVDVPWIDSVNPVKRTIVAYLPDEEGEPGASITLEVASTVHQNAQRYFEEARSQKNKAKGAQAALAGTEQAREKAEKRAAKEAAAGRLRGRQRSKRFWFEKHRWAMLSGGHLLIGGKTRRATTPSYASTWAPTTCTSTPIYTERPHARSSSRTAWLRTRTRLRTSLPVSRQCKSFRISEKALKTLESFPNRCIQRPLKSQSAGPGLGGAGVLLLLHSMSAPVKSQRPQRPASRSPGAHSSFAGRGTGTATCPWSSPSGWRL